MATRPSEDDIRRIYRDTTDALYAFVSRRCHGDRDLAEDVTQETWLRAVKTWRVDGVPDVPIAWLSTYDAVALAPLDTGLKRAVARMSACPSMARPHAARGERPPTPANWYLLLESPYMVYGEVPLPDGRVQRMTEVAIP